MKDYLNRDEKNQIVTLMAVAQQIEGIRTLTGKEGKPIWEAWKDRGFLTKDEGKSIKTAHTYLLKFFKSVLNRVNSREEGLILKQLAKFDFKIIDDFTINKIFRDITNRMQNAVVPRVQFENWCSEIMSCNCKGCQKHWDKCELYTVFEDNFVPEGGYNLENCKYSYDEVKRRDVDVLQIHRDRDKQTLKGKSKNIV